MTFKITSLILATVFLSSSVFSFSTDTTQVAQELTEEEYEAAVEFYLDSIESTLEYQMNLVSLRGDSLK